MAQTLLDNQHVTATLSFVDAAGNPVSLPSGVIPVWTVDSATIVSVVADPTGMTALVTALGPLGTANLTATTTIGSNAPIVATAAVTVSASGTPATATISFGTPVNN